MAKFNYREIRTAIATSDIGRKRVQTVMDNRFAENKSTLLTEFDDNPITKELEAGTENSSFLDGKGSLRGFIGFEAGEDVVGPVRTILERELTMTRKTVSVTANSIQYKFSLRIPQESLRAATPIPWETGVSWLAGLETGRIAGLGNYLSGSFKSPEPSRSGEGIQSKTPVRGGTYLRKSPYLSSLINKFLARFK